MRKRATNAQKKGRIAFVVDALSRDYADDLIIQALVKQGMSTKQAGRYLKAGVEALGLLATQQDPILMGKCIQRAARLSKETFQAALQEDDPNGKKARVSLSANKSVMELMKAAHSLTHQPGGKPNHESTAASAGAETTELASLLQLFSQEKATG